MLMKKMPQCQYNSKIDTKSESNMAGEIHLLSLLEIHKRMQTWFDCQFMSCKSYLCICRIVNIKSIYWAVYEMFIMYELICITVIWFLVCWSSKIVCHKTCTKRLSNCFIVILNSNSNERSQGFYPFGECII